MKLSDFGTSNVISWLLFLKPVLPSFGWCINWDSWVKENKLPLNTFSGDAP